MIFVIVVATMISFYFDLKEIKIIQIEMLEDMDKELSISGNPCMESCSSCLSKCQERFPLNLQKSLFCFEGCANSHKECSTGCIILEGDVLANSTIGVSEDARKRGIMDCVNAVCSCRDAFHSCRANCSNEKWWKRWGCRLKCAWNIIICVKDIILCVSTFVGG